jgi:hypothetical protein
MNSISYILYNKLIATKLSVKEIMYNQFFNMLYYVILSNDGSLKSENKKASVNF